MKNKYNKIVLGVTLLGLFAWLLVSESIDTESGCIRRIKNKNLWGGTCARHVVL